MNSKYSKGSGDGLLATDLPGGLAAVWVRLSDIAAGIDSLSSLLSGRRTIYHVSSIFRPVFSIVKRKTEAVSLTEAGHATTIFIFFITCYSLPPHPSTKK